MSGLPLCKLLPDLCPHIFFSQHSVIMRARTCMHMFYVWIHEYPCVCVHARSPPQFCVSVAAQKAYHACNTFPAYWSVYDPFAHQKWLWKTTIPSPVKLGKGLVVRLKRTQQEFGLNKKKRGRQRKRTDVWHFSREEKKKTQRKSQKGLQIQMLLCSATDSTRELNNVPEV